MGRKTWESIGSQKLSGRINIVVSHQDFPSSKDGGPDQVLFGQDWQSVETLLKHFYPDLKIWIIGGANIFKQAISHCENIYLTHFPGDYNCDTFVPLNDYLANYVNLAKKEQDGLTFSIWRKI